MPLEEPIRVVSAAGIREVSAAEVARLPSPECADVRSKLMAPHKRDLPVPAVKTVADLRAMVGRRDARDPLVAVLAWSRELGIRIGATTGAEVVSWATESKKLRPPSDIALPGDLLVFDHTVGDDRFDLVAIAIERDARGVTEFLYVANGIVRRGLLDTSRAKIHRDEGGATVNTYVRHVKRWPAKGTRYLAGELLGHVVRTR